MTWLRSLAFVAWLYLSMVLFAVGLSPALLMPYRPAMWVIRHWSKFTLFGLRWIAGVKVEFRGVEHMPVGACLIAGKHQSMLDVIAPFAVLPDNCFIMKKELAPLPFFGWFAVKTKMIAVDRSAHSKALKDMVRQARLRFAEGRQMLIFPEGTRAPVGAAPDYKPGIAALYRDLDCPCTPMATNSGVHWPAHGFRRYPGTVVYEFLPAIPAGGQHGWHLFVLRVDVRERFRSHLHDAGVPTGIHYPESLPELAFHRGAVDEAAYPIAIDAAARVVSVPIGEHLTHDEVALVIDTVLSYAP